MGRCLQFSGFAAWYLLGLGFRVSFFLQSLTPPPSTPQKHLFELFECDGSLLNPLETPESPVLRGLPGPRPQHRNTGVGILDGTAAIKVS